MSEMVSWHWAENRCDIRITPLAGKRKAVGCLLATVSTSHAGERDDVQNGLRLSQTAVLMLNNEDMLLQVQVSDEIQSRTAGLSDTRNN